MKNTLLILSFLLFICINVSSQTQFGIYGGVNQTNFKSDDFRGENGASGFSFGISSLSFLTNNSDLIIEFTYDEKKNKCKFLSRLLRKQSIYC